MRTDNGDDDTKETGAVHEDEIKEAAARPADSGEDVGPSAQR